MLVGSPSTAIRIMGSRAIAVGGGLDTLQQVRGQKQGKPTGQPSAALYRATITGGHSGFVNTEHTVCRWGRKCVR